MFNDYEDVITTGLDYDYSAKEIYNAIYKKEFNLYLRKGIPPRVDELEKIVGFCEYFKANKHNAYNTNYELKQASSEKLRPLRKDEEKKVLLKRVILHILNLNEPSDMAKYEEERFEFISTYEGTNPKGEKFAGESYDDSKGYRTVGYGFNMGRGEARQEWNNAFKNEDKVPDFDDVYKGNKKLTKEEMRTLFDHSAKVREKELEIIYRDTWKKMSPNEKLMTESLYYNGGEKIVGNIRDKDGNIIRETRYFQNIKKYIQTGDEKYLQEVYKEVNERSNPKDDNGNLQVAKRRREAEAKIGYSPNIGDKYISPIYRNEDGTNNKLNQFQKYRVLIGQQVPSQYRTYKPYSSGEYFIWRHKSNSNKPNPLHIKQDGLLYKVGSQEWSWLNEGRWKGCKCMFEQVDESKIEVV